MESKNSNNNKFEIATKFIGQVFQKDKIAKAENKKEAQVWGAFNYSFSLKPIINYAYMASNLIAEAHDLTSLVPIPMKCKWVRIKGNRTYELAEITGK